MTDARNEGYTCIRGEYVTSYINCFTKNQYLLRRDAEGEKRSLTLNKMKGRHFMSNAK